MFSCLQILEAFLWFVLITLLNVTLIILTLSVDRKSGSAGMPRPISYAVFCLKKKKGRGERKPDAPRHCALLCYGAFVIDPLALYHLLFFFMTRGPPGSTLFPYTTLFRSITVRIDTLPIVCFHASKSWRLFYGSFLLPF